jgi:hypothetical protein
METKTELVVSGSFSALFGFLVVGFLFPFGLIVGVIVMAWGFSQCRYYLCSNCGNRVEPTSKLCPTCKEALD